MKSLNGLLLLVLIAGVFAVGYGLPREPERVVEVITTPESIVYTPFPEVYLYNGEELSIEQTIKSSLDAAAAHRYWYEQGIQQEHHLYWERVHLSAAYWLGELQ